MWFSLRLSQGLGEFSQQKVNTAFILATRAVRVMVFKERGHIFKLFRYNSVWRCQSGSEVDKKCISLSGRHFWCWARQESSSLAHGDAAEAPDIAQQRENRNDKTRCTSLNAHAAMFRKKESSYLSQKIFSVRKEVLQQEIFHSLTHFLTKLVKLTQQCKVLIWVYNFIQV